MMAESIPNFRPDATKNYILITDAHVHERKPAIDADGNTVIDTDEYEESIKYSSHTIQDVIDAVKRKAKITVVTLPKPATCSLT